MPWGTGAGVIVALAFMIFMYIRKGKHMTDENDSDPYEDTPRAIFSSILSIVTPIIISTWPI